MNQTVGLPREEVENWTQIVSTLVELEALQFVETPGTMTEVAKSMALVRLAQMNVRNDQIGQKRQVHGSGFQA